MLDSNMKRILKQRAIQIQSLSVDTMRANLVNLVVLAGQQLADTGAI